MTIQQLSERTFVLNRPISGALEIKSSPALRNTLGMSSQSTKKSHARSSQAVAPIGFGIRMGSGLGLAPTGSLRAEVDFGFSNKTGYTLGTHLAFLATHKTYQDLFKARGSEVREYFLCCERQARAGGMPVVKDPQIAAVIEARTQPESKHFTVMGYANLIGQSVGIKTAATLGRRCAALSRQRGLVIGDVSDPRFGNVHSYHETVLQELLPTKFNKAA